nr:immunoglobulin heavy chain junction region [Macaca mulatta]
CARRAAGIYGLDYW